jgi:hypothetical protein
MTSTNPGPNTFVDPNQVVATSLSLLRSDVALARTFSRSYEADYGHGRGTTVNVRVPASLLARSRNLSTNTAITLDNVTETTIAVPLNTMAYSAVPVSDEELEFNIVDFARQILAPQVTALGEFIENLAVSTLQAVAEDTTVPYSAANPSATFVAARKKLRDLGLPQTNLYAAVGTQVYADLLASSTLTDASQSGSTDALRNAVAGRVRGFDVIEDNRLGDLEMIFYHGDAVVLAVRAPRVPDGVAFGASQAADGFAVRWIQDYDSTILQDRSILSTFLGCSVVPMKHINATTGAVESVTGVIRVDGATTPA